MEIYKILIFLDGKLIGNVESINISPYFSEIKQIIPTLKEGVTDYKITRCVLQGCKNNSIHFISAP